MAQLCCASMAPPEETPFGDQPSSPDAATIIVVSGTAAGTRIGVPRDVGGRILFGKDETNDLVLRDATVSRQHAVIERAEGGGVIVRDLGSTNGIRIGDATVQEATLFAGATFRLGDVELLLGVDLAGAIVPASSSSSFGIALGTSTAMRRIFAVLERVASHNATILFTGESGTGKDVLARSVHMQSARASGPFEVVDCGAIAPSLIESELFGHERGAFTGAVAKHVGAFERAHGGTIFLDELGELPKDLQPKLLRAVEARAIRPLGATKTIPIDVRIIAATTRDLAEEVRSKTFREDLYYRLAVVSIVVPPLRARVEDIPVIADRLLRDCGAPEGLTLAPATRALLQSYSWPGNVRELRNTLDRALPFREPADLTLKLVDFPPASSDSADRPTFDDELSYRETRARFEADFERRYVEWLLAKHSANVSAAARDARMDRNHLTDLARRHGIEIRRRTR